MREFVRKSGQEMSQVASPTQFPRPFSGPRTPRRTGFALRAHICDCHPAKNFCRGERWCTQLLCTTHRHTSALRLTWQKSSETALSPSKHYIIFLRPAMHDRYRNLKKFNHRHGSPCLWFNHMNTLRPVRTKKHRLAQVPVSVSWNWFCNAAAEPNQNHQT